MDTQILAAASDGLLLMTYESLAWIVIAVAIIAAWVTELVARSIREARERADVLAGLAAAARAAEDDGPFVDLAAEYGLDQARPLVDETREVCR